MPNDVIRLGERLRKDLEEIAFSNNILKEGEPDIKTTIAFLIEKYRQAQKELVKKEAATLKKIFNKIEGAKCVQCGREIKLGELCYYDPENKKVLCARCFVKNNSQGLVNEDLIKAELKLAQLKDEIKALEEEKKKLIKELKIVQIYEELNEKAQLFNNKIEEMKAELHDFAKFVLSSEEDKKKIYESIEELIKTGKEIAQSFKLLAKAILKR
jgi:hypothetical protein